MYDNRTDNQAGLTDAEFACLLFRSCGVPDTQRLAALNHFHNQLACGFCTGEKQVA